MRNAVTYDTIGDLLTEILYNAKGAVAEQNDLAIGRKTVYTYDESGRLLRTLQSGYSDISTSYDVMNRVTGMQYRFAGQQQSASFAYGADGRKGNATLLNGAQRTTTYDSLNRETAASIGALSRTISYVNVSGNRTTTLPASVIYTGGGNTLLNVSYTYDAVGNIATMVQDGVTYTYTYDSLNQLTAVATSDNSYTAAFNYDNGGNLTSKTVNGQTYTYSYGDTEWKDLLTAYNGESITYDQINLPRENADLDRPPIEYPDPKRQHEHVPLQRRRYPYAENRKRYCNRVFPERQRYPCGKNRKQHPLVPLRQ